MQFFQIEETCKKYVTDLFYKGCAESTCVLYEREIKRMECFLRETCLMKSEDYINQECIWEFKKYLMMNYKPNSINTKIAAINGFFLYCNENQFKMKPVKIQRSEFCSDSRNLSEEEYIKLVKAAYRINDEQLAYLLQSICGSGLRISEIKFITVESISNGEVIIDNKGKTRVVLLPSKLCIKLADYIKKKNISEGCIFITKNGRPVDRSNIWKRMKNLCKVAEVDPKKVYPHNLRHLFARNFYNQERNLIMLASILGHTDINTTRIYTQPSKGEQQKCLDAMNLVL